MCESNAYLVNEDGAEELILENVDRVIPQSDGEIILEDIFGKQRTVKARIKELALVEHRIILVKA